MAGHRDAGQSRNVLLSRCELELDLAPVARCRSSQRFRSGLLEGRSAIKPIESYDTSSLRTRLGGEVTELNGKEFVTNRRALRMR